MCLVVKCANCSIKFSLLAYYIRFAEDGIFVFDRFTGEFVHQVMLSDVVGLSLESLYVEEVF